MASQVLNAGSDDALVTILVEAGRKLVVVDFFANWCGPCMMMKPKFKELAAKYTNAVFVECDVDVLQESAIRHGVTAMPTFLFFLASNKVDMMRGADPSGLEEKVQKYYVEEESDDGTSVKGQADLVAFIDEKDSECLNSSDTNPFENALKFDDTYLESECDEQLIMMITFNQVVKLHSLKINGPADSGPKTVKIFTNQPKTLDFESAENMESVQTLILTKEDLSIGSVIPLRFVKFQNVTNITIFVKDNQQGTETTKIDYLSFIGSPSITTKMSDFKRVAGKKGESH